LSIKKRAISSGLNRKAVQSGPILLLTRNPQSAQPGPSIVIAQSTGSADRGIGGTGAARPIALSDRDRDE
jgi:hypothetical protein